MNEKKRKRKGVAIVILFGCSFLMLLAGSLSKEAARWYSFNVYPLWVQTIGRFFGLFPFSAAEICLYAGIFLCLFFLARFLWRLVKRKQRPHEISEAVLHFFLTAAILFFVFTLNCGMNYLRPSFSEEYHIETTAYSVSDLARVCRILTDDVNQWGKMVKREEHGLAVSGESRKAERTEAVSAMQKLGSTYPALKGYYPKPKGLMLSEFLSYQSLSGIYSPFTVEANYNQDMTPYNIPFTMCHELSHLRGFMQEEEANFIAYLACLKSESEMFRYSGSLLGWIYCMNVLRDADPVLHGEIRKELLPEVEKDLEANSVFWNQYEGTISEVSNKVNDTYLKANGQNDGVESYDRMVDLLVAYYK